MLSPFLRVTFLNNICRVLDKLRGNPQVPLNTHLDLFFADDVAAIMAARERPVLAGYAGSNVANVRATLEKRFLGVQGAKTRNLLLDPALLSPGVYRGRPPL